MERKKKKIKASEKEQKELWEPLGSLVTLVGEQEGRKNVVNIGAVSLLSLKQQEYKLFGLSAVTHVKTCFFCFGQRGNRLLPGRISRSTAERILRLSAELLQNGCGLVQVLQVCSRR